MTASPPPTAAPSLDEIRAAFPALAQPTVFLENAGGSQVPAVVADRIYRYMRETYVQLGADYALSKQCTQLVEDAHDFTRMLFGGDGLGEVVLGPSSSQLCRTVADAFAETIQPGDEIVIAECGHEANIGPWLRLEKDGATIRWWRVDPETGASPLEALDAVLSERTRLIAYPHVSNLLGEIIDVAAVSARARSVGAKTFVDGVAFAPHRALDVAAWDCDWYVYSIYKVFGPHMAALFGRHDAFEGLVGPNHFFVPDNAIPYKFELGGVSHEGCAGLLALGDYLAFLTGHETCTRETVLAASARFEALEDPLQERLVGWLAGKEQVRIVGPGPGGAPRVPTVSFTHAEKKSRAISLEAEHRDVAIRHGHMYAHRLCTALEIPPLDGVVRISALHYNTPDEIERLIEILDPVL